TPVEARTFYGDVAPLLADACGSCHAAGGISAIAFETFEDVVEWAPAIKAAVDSRAMPPFNLNNDGSCNTYADARWLGEEEIAVIDDWIEGGLKEGDVALGMPEPSPLPRLEGANITTLAGPTDYHPISEGLALAAADDYQCFLVDPGLDRDKFLVGYDVQPGNASVVHHVIGFNVDLDRTVVIPGQGVTTNRALIDDLQAQSPDTEGWDCFSAAGEGVMIEGVPVTWAPGTGATRFPEGTGIRIADDEVMVLQIHYNLAADDGVPDNTTVDLDLVDEVDREAHMVLADGFLMTLLSPEPAELPPGEADAEFSWSMALDELPSQDLSHLDEIEVLGILPHMHERGRTMTVEFETDEGASCGAQVDRWAFEWQQAYFLEQPLRTRVGNPMNVSCTYDTRSAEGPVGPGFGTADEMCLAGVYIAPAR
ncbi:MAG: hypothetical protein AAF721_04570, partial [Myxococcota bacterium]